MSPVDTARRAFLKGRMRRDPVLRPPWPASEEAFAQLCTRCGECVRACETQILIPGDGGFPEVDFSLGECTFCQACVQACPAPVFDVSAGASPWNNVASIDAGCLGFQGVYCKSCGEVCEVRAIRFTFNSLRVPEPSVDSEACNGCGACVSICPIEAVKVMPESLGDIGEQYG